MIFTNLISGSDEQPAGIDYLPNQRISGPISTVAGRYYLIALSLKTDTRYTPPLIIFSSGLGMTASLIKTTSINTSFSLSPNYPALTAVYKSIGVWLYGGYCTTSNPSWSFSVTFGRCGYSSYAYSIDEVQGTTAAPIVQSTAAQTNSATLLPTLPLNGTYMVGMSMVPNSIYPTDISPTWRHLSTNHGDVVPNLFTGYNVTPLGSPDTNPSWIDRAGNGTQGPYLEKAILTCELQHNPAYLGSTFILGQSTI